jgi:hypothetical protein
LSMRLLVFKKLALVLEQFGPLLDTPTWYTHMIYMTQSVNICLHIFLNDNIKLTFSLMLSTKFCLLYKAVTKNCFKKWNQKEQIIAKLLKRCWTGSLVLGFHIRSGYMVRLPCFFATIELNEEAVLK